MCQYANGNSIPHIGTLFHVYYSYRQFPHLPNVASICIYPPFVETVGVVVDGTDMRITSVAGGFPSSQTFLEVKVLEVAMAVENGADEIDIVLNVGKMLEGHYDDHLLEPDGS